MSKRLFIVLLLLPATLLVQRQEDTISHYPPIIGTKRLSLLSNVDIIAHMRAAFNQEFENGSYQRSRFSNEQFRLEIKGKIHDKVYFRFRNRYTSATDPQSLDNISRSVDMAFLKVDVTPKWGFHIGKMSADWGGYEFDANPLDIYEYSDILAYSDNFLTGVGLSLQTSKKHEFTVQLLNSRSKTFNELYDTIPGIRASNFPFAAIINWRGSLAEGKFNTIWSYSLFQEAENKYMNYIALGNELKLKRFTLKYDFKMSKEELDRKTIVSSFFPVTPLRQIANDVRYLNHWLQLNVWINQKVKLFFVGMVDVAFWKGNPDPEKEDKLRTSWGYTPGIEVFPFKDLNLRFFAAFISRVYNYTDYARTKFNMVNSNNYRISIGVTSSLLLL